MENQTKMDDSQPISTRICAQNPQSDDPMENPYYLHHSDNPGAILVSQLLSGDNYASWKRSMLIALSVKNKMGFVDGTIKKPPPGDPMINKWTRNNNIVVSWLLNSVSKEISSSIQFGDSAETVWNDLRDRYQRSNGPRIFQTLKDLVNLSKESRSVTTHYTRVKSLWEEFQNFKPSCTYGDCTCGAAKCLAAFNDNVYAMVFLMGLSDSYSNTRGQIMLMDPIPPMNKVFSLITQE